MEMLCPDSLPRETCCPAASSLIASASECCLATGTLFWAFCVCDRARQGYKGLAPELCMVLEETGLPASQFSFLFCPILHPPAPFQRYFLNKHSALVSPPEKPNRDHTSAFYFILLHCLGEPSHLFCWPKSYPYFLMIEISLGLSFPGSLWTSNGQAKWFHRTLFYGFIAFLADCNLWS